MKKAIEEYLSHRELECRRTTIAGYEGHLKHFCMYMHNCDMEDVKIKDVVAYFDMMLYLGWDRTSVRHRGSTLRKFFRFFVMQGMNVLNPELIPMVEESYTLTEIPTEEEYRKLATTVYKGTGSKIKLRNRVLLGLLWDTGARVGEILSLDMEDIDTSNMSAIIRTKKSKGLRPFRYIFWSEETNKYMKEWLEKRKKEFPDNPALFVGFSGGGLGKKMKRRGVQHMLKTYSKKAGVKYYHPHAFRHRLAHHISDQGGDGKDIAHVLGHSSIQSSLRYLRLNKEETEKIYKRFTASS